MGCVAHSTNLANISSVVMMIRMKEPPNRPECNSALPPMYLLLSRPEPVRLEHRKAPVNWVQLYMRVTLAGCCCGVFVGFGRVDLKIATGENFLDPVLIIDSRQLCACMDEHLQLGRISDA